MSVILGIDPGLATVGFGAIEVSGNKFFHLDSGVIKTAPNLDTAERLHIIRNDLQELIKSLKPSLVSIEELFFARNVTNAIKVAQARGVIVEVVYDLKIPMVHFTPLQVKNNIAGDGAAKKWQIQEMVKRLLNLSRPPKPDDAADALALALCAQQSLPTLKAMLKTKG